jgi:hypothetical protein
MRGAKALCRNRLAAAQNILSQDPSSGRANSLVPGPNILPVELLSFDGAHQSGVVKP